MIKFTFLIIIVLIILFILKNNSNAKSNKYRNLIFLVIIFGIFFILITSGKLVLPQLLQILKIGLPFLTKFIGL